MCQLFEHAGGRGVGAYDDFEQRVAQARNTVGSKQDRVRTHILEQAPTGRWSDSDRRGGGGFQRIECRPT